MKRWTFRVLIAIVVIAAVVVGMGWMIPAEHTATLAAVYSQPPDAVWTAITNWENFPAWRAGVEAVKPLPSSERQPAWVETSSTGELPLETLQAAPPRRLVLRIASDELPFGGTWTYELTPVIGGTELRITEHGQIHNPFFRFMARFVFGYEATMEQYLTALGRKFGQEVSVTE